MISKDERPENASSPVDTTDPSPAGSSRQNPFLFLRRMAEQYLREQKSKPPYEQNEALSSKQVQGIISELQTHQLELERQNEELRRTQVELESARRRYFDLYDLAPVGYCTVSEKGLILETNLAAANLFGVARGVLPNQPFSRFILKEDQDIFYLLRKQLFATGELQAGELRIIRQDGTLFWVTLKSTLGVNASGMAVSRVVLSNITKRKVAEGALQKSHQQNQAILDSITDAFISLTDEMIVSYFNTAAEKMFKRKRTKVIGRKLFDVLPAGKGTIFEDKYSQAIRKKSPVAFEAQFNFASCHNWYGVRVYPSTEGITIYLQVITERKKEEEEKAKLRSVKRQLQKAESLERMAGAIAHLFNNHFQVALGNLEMALDSLAADAGPREYLINAIQANRRSSDVSGLLLTYLGQKIGKLESIDLVNLCQQNLPGTEAAMPSNISLETHFMSPGPIVRANASQMEQVVTILLTNAMEAIADSTGKVTVVIKPVPASLIPDSHVSHIEWVTTSEMFTCLEVTDTGCGMVKEEMGKIFDPFFTTKYTGRGLGLAVAMSLVRAWGGMIHVHSEIQKGSCFSVYLPFAADRAAQQADLLTEEETSKTEGTVLLVDDDPILCHMGKAVLELLGFSVFVARGGHEAVTLFQKHHNTIDCLLTDLSMPDMDGWETLAALRKIKPDLPVILSSGYDEAHAMRGDHKELPQAFLHKPYTKDNLQKVLNRILGDATRGAI